VAPWDGALGRVVVEPLELLEPLLGAAAPLDEPEPVLGL
jgi:hypothetical protein